MLCRQSRPDVLEFLAVKRKERFKKAAIKKIQALWKAVLVQRRFIQLQEAAGAGSPLPAPGQPGAPPGSGQGRFYHAVDDER